MHVLVNPVALLAFAWHTSGYAVDYAATSFESDDVEHVDPNPTPDGKNPTEETKPFDINNMTEEQIKAYILFFYGEEGEEDYYDSVRSKRSVPEDKIEDIVTTEHIVIPEDRAHTSKEEKNLNKSDEFQKPGSVKKTIENGEYPQKTGERKKAVDKLTILDEKDTHETDELKKPLDTTNDTIKDSEDFRTTDEWQETEDIAKHTIKNREDTHETDKWQKAEVTKDPKFEKGNTSSREMNEDDIEHISEEFESMEHTSSHEIDEEDDIDHISKEFESMAHTSTHEIDEEDDIEHISEEFESREHTLEDIDALLMLEDDFFTKEDEESEGLEEFERWTRDSEWFGPICTDYPWYPYWCPPIYPWGLYQGWSPYYFNPYPVVIPVNIGTSNIGTSDSWAAEQYTVPVKEKVTIAASFTDGTWTLPVSRFVPETSYPCFYPQNDCAMPVYDNIPDATNLVRNEPANLGSGLCVKRESIPVSGKVTIAAHFC